MTDIGEFIKSGGICFYNKDKKLCSNLKNFGEYNWDLANHIVSQSSKYLTIKGGGLEKFLCRKENVGELTEFLIQLLSSNKNNDLKVHIEADVVKIGQTKKYLKEKDFVIGDVFGFQKRDLVKWFPEMSYFEILWNYHLCDSFGGWIGYPGYEWPRTKESFRYEIVNHATFFVIGTKDQLKRYQLLTEEAQIYKDEISELIKNFS